MTTGRGDRAVGVDVTGRSSRSEVYRRAAGVPILLEWDAEIPSFEQTHAEALRAREFIGAEA